MKSQGKKERIPRQVQPRYQEILAQIEKVCGELLNEEYLELGRKLLGKLARKRLSPILRGKSEIWACAIMYALGTVNFLFDPEMMPHVRPDDLCRAFGVNRRTGETKAREIRKMFHMFPMVPEWSLESSLDDNPLVWFLEVDGIVVDIRRMPREIQVQAYEQGLIPYIPADRTRKDADDLPL